VSLPDAPARAWTHQTVPTFLAPDGYELLRRLRDAGRVGEPVAADEQPSRPGK
jgi:hypothetical protein